MAAKGHIWAFYSHQGRIYGGGAGMRRMMQARSLTKDGHRAIYGATYGPSAATRTTFTAEGAGCGA